MTQPVVSQNPTLKLAQTSSTQNSQVVSGNLKDLGSGAVLKQNRNMMNKIPKLMNTGINPFKATTNKLMSKSDKLRSEKIVNMDQARLDKQESLKQMFDTINFTDKPNSKPSVQVSKNETKGGIVRRRK